MKCFRNTTDIYIEEDTVITLGKFDGLHSGHRVLVEALRKEKEKTGFKSVVFTFSRLPKEKIEKKKQPFLLSMEEKESLLEKSGVDYVIEYPFTEEVRRMEAEDFVAMLVEKLHVKVFVIGTDFSFGYEKRGNYGLLQSLSQNYGFRVLAFTKKQKQGEDISSTRIRNAILNGDIQTANELLGYPYFFEGEVQNGRKIGRTIGIPTVNLTPHERKLLPPFGVYASETVVDGKTYLSLSNIGKKPTVGDDNPVGLETYIFDFHEEIYGKPICVKLLQFIRGEKKFESVEELKQQIQLDITKILQTVDKKVSV
ncbi:MAG: bifunctional riboflavin kinase/FAD synthetase [Lachnospiraceae bacterium]|jgi:riboflavin kinase/FMN adenylyltransferase|nr:bifunctional riboflavin kinase/FAD synthetase [Lachnospiraceae bacterium]